MGVQTVALVWPLTLMRSQTVWTLVSTLAFIWLSTLMNSLIDPHALSEFELTVNMWPSQLTSNLSNFEVARQNVFWGFDGIRTRGLCVRAAVLYKLSYEDPYSRPFSPGPDFIEPSYFSQSNSKWLSWADQNYFFSQLDYSSSSKCVHTRS